MSEESTLQQLANILKRIEERHGTVQSMDDHIYVRRLHERARQCIATLFSRDATIAEHVSEGMHCDGARHKQYHLRKIAEALGIDVTEEDKGVAP